MLPPYKGGANIELGSLLKLFNSEYFTIDMLFYYFYHKFCEQGVQDYLINKMYKIDDLDINFYIPQLWQIKILLILIKI